MEENNKVHLTGQIVSDFEYSHETFGEKFYKVKMEVLRLSGNVDILPLIISEKLVDTTKNMIGEYIEVFGQYRSYNIPINENKTKLVLYVFVQEWIPDVEGEDALVNVNIIELDGYVCKEPYNRKTPLGREITDLLVVSNRNHRQSDYIPCIAWGRNAKFSSVFPIGQHIKITGRIQSRNYDKKMPDGTYESRIAYEVSILKMKKSEEEISIEDEN